MSESSHRKKSTPELKMVDKLLYQSINHIQKAMAGDSESLSSALALLNTARNLCSTKKESP